MWTEKDKQLNKFRYKGHIEMKAAQVLARSALHFQYHCWTCHLSTEAKDFQQCQLLPKIPKQSTDSTNSTFTIDRKQSRPQDIKNAIQIMTDSAMMHISANTFEEREAWRVDFEKVTQSFYMKKGTY